jgi:transposase
VSGLGWDLRLTVVGCLELDRCEITAGLEEAPVVEPVDVFEGGDLDLLDGPPRAPRLDQLVLNNPIIDSARALSQASPTAPTEGVAPASVRRSVNAIEVYWADSTGRRNTPIVEVLMGRPAGWMRELTGRSPMKSPGKPSLRRDVERLFWREIAKGLSSEDAAIAVGVSQGAGTRWFRERGGMPTFLINPVTGRYLSFEEREVMGLLKAQGGGVREIARELGRDRSTVSRELRRNAATRGGKQVHHAGPPAPAAGVRRRTASEERPRAGRLRS